MIKMSIDTKNRNNWILSSNSTFNVNYEDWWLDEPFTIKVLQEVEGITKRQGNLFYNLKFDTWCSPEKLSGGVKSLLILKFMDLQGKLFPTSLFGSNCYPYLQEALKDKDTTLVFNSVIEDFNYETGDILILETEKVVSNLFDLSMEAALYDECNS